jgi:capsular exopolysaccharide synthesis family protein
VNRTNGTGRTETAGDENSLFKEALRHLHTTVAISNHERQPKSILIASSLPDEGKTSLACSFARYLSMAGKAVVVIDCDLRNPQVHKHFGVQASLGLNDYFAGRVSLTDIVLEDDRSKVRIVPAGTVKPSAVHRKVLEDVDVFDLLITFQNDFDFVIIDSPPVLPVSDVRVLARQVDCTVYLTRWGTTPRRVAQEGLRLITESSDSVLGVLLTRVDLRKYGRYRPYGSVYSNKYLRKYYS